jgi:hypothetical protein
MLHVCEAISTTFVGSSSGSVAGTGTNAQMKSPTGIAIDSSDNYMYIGKIAAYRGKHN